MVEQKTASTKLTISENGRKRGVSMQWHQTVDAKTKIGEGVRKKARERKEKKESRESMDVVAKWAKPLSLRGACSKTIAKLLNSSQDEGNTKSINFAKGLLSEGLIGEDLTDWRFLLLNYRKNKRKLPASFSDMLRLEVFYRGIREARGGGFNITKFIQKYRI